MVEADLNKQRSHITKPMDRSKQVCRQNSSSRVLTRRSSKQVPPKLKKPLDRCLFVPTTKDSGFLVLENHSIYDIGNPYTFVYISVYVCIQIYLQLTIDFRRNGAYRFCPCRFAMAICGLDRALKESYVFVSVCKWRMSCQPQVVITLLGDE